MAREMKDSGINWLPKIPITWETNPLKNLFNVGKGLSITKDNLEEQGIPTVSYGQIHAKYNTGTKLDDRMFRYVNESYLKTNPNALVSKGCFVFADTSEDLDGCGNCIYVDKNESFFAGYHTVTLFPKEGKENKYFAYLFKTDEWRSQIRAGLTEVKLYSVPQKVIRRTQIIVPPLKEQLCIASFLDTKCAEIDKAIESTKKSIEEYRKLRQSIITEAVTKGLDPNAEMKDSGIEWIGEIPKHWEIPRIKFYSYMKGRIGWQGLKSDDFIDNGPFCITGTDFENGRVNWDRCYHVSEERYNMDPYIQVKPGDLLITKDGTIGKLALINELPQKACLNSHLLIIRPEKNKYLNSFLFYVLSSLVFVRYYRLKSSGTTMDSLSQEKLGEFSFPLPSLNEQTRIADYLDTKCAEIDSLIKSKEKLIDELTAYRKSLIYEYVTGKKEVPAV